MRLEIEVLENGDREVKIGGRFVGTWGPGVDVMKVMVPFVLDRAFEMGEAKRAKDIARLLK